MIHRICIAVLLLTASVAQAQNFLGCDWSLTGHALYWQGVQAPFKFAQSSREPPNLALSQLRTESAWGYHLEAGVHKAYRYASLGYIWFQSHQATGTKIPNAYEFFGVDGTYEGYLARFALDYQTASLKLGQYLLDNDSYNIHLFINCRWTDLSRSTTSMGRSAPNSGLNLAGRWRQKASFQGGGLGLGTGADLCIAEQLKLFGSLGLTALVGKQRTPLNRSATDTGVDQNMTYPTDTTLVPMMEIKVGAQLFWEWSCTEMAIEVGYQLDYYWKSLQYEDPSTLLLTGARQCYDIGFGGVFFGGRISY